MVLLLGKGNGTFDSPSYFFSTGGGIDYMAVGDFNGDGKPDLVGMKVTPPASRF